jgi:hypothetical protein
MVVYLSFFLTPPPWLGQSLAVSTACCCLFAGTPFPVGHEALLMRSVLQLLFSSTAHQPAAAAGTSAAAAAEPLQPALVGRLVERAMKPTSNAAAAREAKTVSC